jgi:hypothetical protein
MLLTDLNAPVQRRDYLIYGFVLALVKYAGDVAIVWFGAHFFWTPLDYVQSVWSLLTRFRPPRHQWMLLALAVWTVPFIWVGFTLSARRAKNAGLSVLTAIWFFVPYANYLLMAVLCLRPEEVPAPVTRQPDDDRTSDSSLSTSALAITAGLAVALVMVAITVVGLNRYGAVLFFLTPFMMGAVTTYVLNRRTRTTGTETTSVVLALFGFTAVALLMLAFEGLMCLIMALPIAIALGLFGSFFVRQFLSDSTRAPSILGMMLAILPVSAFVEPTPAAALYEVRSAVDVNAAPMEVWHKVVAFPPLPKPTDWLFTSGIAYPMAARIEGAGVGAVRYCEFSTGAFVEPITTWEPGARLSFAVTASPPPLREWSPYAGVAPPHLDGYLRSRRGEFRLIALPDGRTRLEGSTWYELRIAPVIYWKMFSDTLIRRIHLRVLDHVRVLAENGRN